MTFEGAGSGTVLMNANVQNTKAMELNNLMESIAEKIHQVDSQIEALVLNGIEGSSVEAMSKTYMENREVINNYVKRFATTACVLSANAIRSSNVDSNSASAAGGVR